MRLLLGLLMSMALTACGGGGGSSGGVVAGNNAAATESDAPTEGMPLFSVWVMNDNGERSAVLMDGSVGIEVNVQAVTAMEVSSQLYALVEATGIPNYTVTITQDQVDWLNSRPRAASDFISGATSASAGDEIDFGENIGYDNTNCPMNEGRGYWPPGPGCPEDQGKEGYFTAAPTPTTSDCEGGGGPVGYAVNGTSIYNWTDAQSYNNEGVWNTLAPLAEYYDVDICGGHAANGDYHHHFYSQCWATVAGEEENGHSPIYGYAADGYPVYGPWHDSGVLAKSCWQTRDYSAVSPTGCGVDGERSCVMVDEYDPDQGTESSASGPSTSGTFTNLSKNTFDTVAGFFYEDYYFDPSCPDQGDDYLDEHNGHEHGELGYHYHLTIDADGTPVFPFTIGPRYAGELPANAIASCGGMGGGGGGAGGGGGGPMPPPPPPST